MLRGREAAAAAPFMGALIPAPVPLRGRKRRLPGGLALKPVDSPRAGIGGGNASGVSLGFNVLAQGGTQAKSLESKALQLSSDPVMLRANLAPALVVMAAQQGLPNGTLPSADLPVSSIAIVELTYTRTWYEYFAQLAAYVWANAGSISGIFFACLLVVVAAVVAVRVRRKRAASAKVAPEAGDSAEDREAAESNGMPAREMEKAGEGEGVAEEVGEEGEEEELHFAPQAGPEKGAKGLALPPLAERGSAPSSRSTVASLASSVAGWDFGGSVEDAAPFQPTVSMGSSGGSRGFRVSKATPSQHSRASLPRGSRSALGPVGGARAMPSSPGARTDPSALEDLLEAATSGDSDNRKKLSATISSVTAARRVRDLAMKRADAPGVGGFRRPTGQGTAAAAAARALLGGKR